MADRLPYNEAIAASWKEQTLLNIVKMRYSDLPFFVEVPQVTAGYTLQAVGTTNGGIFPPVSNLASFAQQLGLTLNLQAAYQDRPTVSYQPQTGAQFIRNFTTPINPGSVLFLLQSGYPADIIFNLTVDTINGVRNQSVTAGQLRPADPEFLQITQTLRKAQMAGHVGIRVEAGKKDSVAFFFRDKDADPQLAAELVTVRRLLRLDPGTSEFHVSFGANASNPKEIAILTRSVSRILQELSSGVEVPGDHLTRGIAADIGHDPAMLSELFHIHSGCNRPCDPFVAVCYEGRWFWIEKDDLVSKRTLGQLLVLLALADTGTKENLPVITIQAN
ncbi:MAG: hypothetical protein K1X57_13145 [Gemmataceae bacterium]|nr:hypothetical protein [Gemmataceae bacterium]